MATFASGGALLVATLCIFASANYAECARLMSRGSGAVIGQEAGAVTGRGMVKVCGNHADEICSLPGLNGIPHVRMRAGYITVSEVSDRQLWYLVADREREDDVDVDGDASLASETRLGQRHTATTATTTTAGEPEDGSGDVDRRPDSRGGDGEEDEADPVILWLTGGPGCSSLDAFIYEHGPFKFSYSGGAAAEAEAAEVQGAEAEEAGDASEGARERKLQQRRPVVLDPNPYSWTKLATVIYVDSPAGSGMSYSGRPDVDYHTNDEYTIADLIIFLEGLTARYPELGSAPFFLAGESYGGVFVPLLARELLRVNSKRRKEDLPPLVNLQGYSVGNPVTDDVIDGNAQMYFAADMGYVDPPTWRHIRTACDDMFWNATRDSACWEAQSVVKDDLWDLNWYDVLDACAKLDDEDATNLAAASATAAGAANLQPSASDLARRFYWPFTARMGAPEELITEAAAAAAGAGPELEEGRRGGVRLWGPRLRHVVPCMDRRIAIDWLNRDDVRAALHAAPLSQLPDWQPCSDVLYYRLDTMDLVPVHEDLVRQGLRGLVYTGDHDMVVPHTGTRKWLYDKADLGGTDGPLRVWLLHGQVAGFTAHFSAGAGLRFVSVKGAGHMVPQSKPQVALHLLKSFLYDEEL